MYSHVNLLHHFSVTCQLNLFLCNQIKYEINWGMKGKIFLSKDFFRNEQTDLAYCSCMRQCDYAASFLNFQYGPFQKLSVSPKTDAWRSACIPEWVSCQFSLIHWKSSHKSVPVLESPAAAILPYYPTKTLNISAPCCFWALGIFIPNALPLVHLHRYLICDYWELYLQSSHLI